MRTVWQKLGSRKFLLTAGAFIVCVTMAANGEITWAQAIYTLVPLVLGYLGIEGALDIKALQTTAKGE